LSEYGIAPPTAANANAIDQRTRRVGAAEQGGTAR
jgi:hypothetical protein